MIDSLKSFSFSKLLPGAGTKTKAAAPSTEVAQSPTDAAEISSASEAAPASVVAKAGKTGFGTKALAAMGIAAALTCAVGSTPAMAQGWGGHHRPPVMRPYGGGYGGGWERHHNNGAAIAGAVVGGIILGEIINNASQGGYYNPPPVYYNPPPQPFRDGYGYLHCPDIYNGGYYISTRPNVCTTY